PRRRRAPPRAPGPRSPAPAPPTPPRPRARRPAPPAARSPPPPPARGRRAGRRGARPRAAAPRRRPAARRAGPSQHAPELLQHAHVALVEVADVGDGVGHQRQALDAEAEGEAGDALVAGGLEHLGVHHAAAAQLEPLLAAGARAGPTDGGPG